MKLDWVAGRMFSLTIFNIYTHRHEQTNKRNKLKYGNVLGGG